MKMYITIIRAEIVDEYFKDLETWGNVKFINAHNMEIADWICTTKRLQIYATKR